MHIKMNSKFHLNNIIMKNILSVFALVCMLLGAGLSELQAQTVSDYAVLGGGFPLSNNARTKSFTFNAPDNFVKGTRLAKPLFSVDVINATRNQSRIALQIFVNGKRAASSINLGEDGSGLRTVTFAVDGNLFRPGSRNTVEFRQSEGSMTVANAVLFYQVRL